MRCKWEGQQTVQAARKPDTRCPRPGTPYLTADVSILLEPVNRRRLCLSLFSGDLPHSYFIYLLAARRYASDKY